MFVLRVLIGAWFAFFASLALCLAQQQSLETELSAIASDLPSGSPSESASGSPSEPASGSASGSFSSDFSDQGFPSYSRSDMASYADLGAIDTPRSFVGGAFSETDALSMGLNFNEFPKDYRNGLLITKGRWAVKFGGYVKADLIHDRDPIDSTDFFDPASIPVGALDRTNTRFHARQTRLNMDARWITEAGTPLRFMVEGDFYGSGNTFRLRHAYGEYDHWIVGQTWTTFTHRAALPNTLDNVGDVASVGRRQAQLRYTRKWYEDRWSWSSSIENPNAQPDEFLLENNLGMVRNPLPDLVTRLRYTADRGQIQLAGLARQLAYEPNLEPVRTAPGGGLNGTFFLDIAKRCRTYGGVLWGRGIGSYRDLPDYALVSDNQGQTLDSLAWYSGLTHQWNTKWSTNLTVSEGTVSNLPGQSLDSIHRLRYLAVNLIWQPNPYAFAGAEYLWGSRENFGLDSSEANRFMVSFGFLLP